MPVYPGRVGLAPVASHWDFSHALLMDWKTLWLRNPATWIWWFLHTKKKNGLYFPYLSQWFKGWRNERKLFERNVGLIFGWIEFSKLSIQLHSYFCTPEKNGLYFTYLSQWFKGRRNERKLFKRYVGLKTKIKWGIMEPSAEGSDLATKVLRLKTLTLSWWPNHWVHPFCNRHGPGEGCIAGALREPPIKTLSRRDPGDCSAQSPFTRFHSWKNVPMSLPKGHGDRGPYFTTPYQRWWNRAP